MAVGIFKLIGKSATVAMSSLKNGGKVVEGVRQGEGTLHFLARNTLGTKTGKVLGWTGGLYAGTALSGKGLISATSGIADDILLDKEERGKGTVKGIFRQLADASMGKGSADAINETATGLAQGAVDGLKKVKDTASEMVGAGTEMVQGAVQGMGGGGQQQPMYADPNTGYVPQQTMMNGGAGQFTGMFNSVPQMLGNVTGSNVTMTNLAGLIASAYMMMGPFGWMGKIASLLTGNMALKSMRQQPAYAIPQQGYYPQIQQQPYYPAVQENPQQQEDNNPVYRSRHL